MPAEGRVTRSGLRTPRAAAIAGILFALLLGVAFVLIFISQPADPAKPGAWLSDPSRRDAVAVALNLVPFAGIAVAIVLLVSIGLTPWVALLFPAWILLLSVEILRTGLRRPPAAAETAADAA